MSVLMGQQGSNNAVRVLQGIEESTNEFRQ